jgi:hypothetical protein
MSDEVFHVGNGTPANFSTGKIKVSVNGTLYSDQYMVGSSTIGQILDQVARAKGIKAFTAYADGTKLLPVDSGKPATQFKEIDLVAKDSRG